MGVSIHRYAYVRVTHKVLECLGGHSCSCHIAAVCMPANVWGYARHLEFEYFIVPCDCVLEPMLPMHCDFWHTVLISEKKATVAVYHYFRRVIGSALRNGLKHLIDIICHRQFSCACVGFGRFDKITHIGSPLQLVIYVNDAVFHINIRTCLRKKCVRIFEHNFVADKARIRRRAFARQGFLTQSAAKFAEKTCAYACEDGFLYSIDILSI